MSSTQMRFKALENLENKVEKKNGTTHGQQRISEVYGIYVFDRKKMSEYLSEEAFQQVEDAIEKGSRIDHTVADQVASAMKNWALELNATHYTHWFQPLTGLTAEKHDSFFELKDGEAIESFNGGALIQQEPDASSFPSGGIRTTFEARGYTAWDPSSPAFLMQSPRGATLCIPTIFVSYTGEALDYKAPLLRALHALDQSATAVCQYFDPNVKKVHATLGVEQEYFLIDQQLVKARPDLLLSGRTLFGHSPAKGQQLEDHYFGSIPERVSAFMADFEQEALKLGIPLKTRHNEVAPSQFECAPMFEEVNIAVDHNQLLMDILDRIAKRHHFICLLHEKPFAGINGSGKHNNWSIATDTGVNLLSPGSTPNRNLQFLTFLINIIKAVHDHADLLRASIASASNDHRLGANEAPPAIISIFMGETLTKVLDQLDQEDEGALEHSEGSESMHMDIPKIPLLNRDNTDRNRTSPFAFTGNKFEFRAVGSSANSSSPMMMLNSIVADRLRLFKKDVDQLINEGAEKEVAILKVLKQYNAESKAVRFEGNNYSEEWVKEATRRGLPNVDTTPEALAVLLSEKTKKLFSDNRILTEREVEARYEIRMDIYIKQLQIEARLMVEVAQTQILPAAVRYQNELLVNVDQLHEVGLKDEAKVIREAVKEISSHISGMLTSLKELQKEELETVDIDDPHEKGERCCRLAKTTMETLRHHADKLEMLVDDKHWPLPKYRELLFLR